jgi:type I restriction enzyme S subunit
VAVADFEGITANTTFVLESSSKDLMPEFLPFVMTTEAFHEHSIKQSKGSVNPYINFSDLTWYEFALPPLDEQQRIAETLNALDCAIDVLAENISNAQSWALLSRQAAVADTLRRLSLIDCRHLTLGEVATWSSGGTPKSGVPEYYGGSVPWAVIGDLTDGDVWETKSSITDLGLASSSAKLIPAGAVLVAMYGSIGKLGIARISLSTNQAIASAVVNPKLVLPEYLFWWLRYIEPLLCGQGKGGVQQNISQMVIKRTRIVVPPLGEQAETTEYLSAVWDSFESITTILGAKLSLLSSIRTSARESLVNPRIVK